MSRSSAIEARLVRDVPPANLVVGSRGLRCPDSHAMPSVEADLHHFLRLLTLFVVWKVESSATTTVFDLLTIIFGLVVVIWKVVSTSDHSTVLIALAVLSIIH